jgi:uncharacterized protein (TIRG00374 family)
MKRMWTVLRIAVGVALIVFLLWKCNLGRILQHMRNMEISYLALALLIYLIFIIISAWRWQLLLEHKKIAMPFLRTLAVYFISIFFSNVFPTTIGGDVMRIVYGPSTSRTESLGTVIADRILGFIGLFLFALVWVLYVMIFQRRIEFLSFTVIGLAILLLLTYFLFSERVYSFFAPWLQKIRIFRLGERLSNLHRMMTAYGGAWGLLAFCVLQSMAIQALLAIAPLFVLRSMGDFQIGILPFFIYVPVINIISMLPVSLNALGVRENAYVLFFSRVGLDGAVSFTMSLVSFFMFFILSLIGGICFLFYRNRKKT